MTQQRIYFNSRDKLIRLDIQKIVYFEGDGNYTNIVTANSQKVCLTMNLAHTEEALASQLGEQAKRFIRIGKRFIVNMNYIYQVAIIDMDDNQELSAPDLVIDKDGNYATVGELTNDHAPNMDAVDETPDMAQTDYDFPVIEV